MWWKIAKKEFLLNLLSTRFVIALVLCLLLIPVTMVISLDAYKKQLRTYQVDREKAEKELNSVRVYSAVRPTLVFPPSPLSIFCQGISGQVGHSVKIKVGEKPLLGEGKPNGRDNPLLMSFFSIDFVHILAILISLLALVFSYDLFSGEKEKGTLKLLLANPVRRSTLVFAKIAGVFLTLMPILVLCYSISILIVLLSPQVSFSAADWLGIGILFMASFFFMAFFVGIGILVSVKGGSSFNGIVVSLFLWLWFLFLWPNISVFYAQSNVKTQMLDQLQQSLWNCEQDMWKKQSEFRGKLPNLGNWWNCNNGDDGLMELSGSPLPTMNDERQFKGLFEPVRIDYADKKWQLQKVYLEKLNKQEQVARYLSFLSPSELFSHLCSLICGTGAQSYQIQVDRSRNYRDVLVNYFVENKIFSSYKYITPQPENTFFKTREEQLTFVTGGVCKNGEDLQKWREAHGGSWSILWKVPYPEGSYSTYPPLDLSSLPKFDQYSISIKESLPLIIIETGVLLIIFLILFSLIFNVCIKYDVR